MRFKSDDQRRACFARLNRFSINQKDARALLADFDKVLAESKELAEKPAFDAAEYIRMKTAPIHVVETKPREEVVISIVRSPDWDAKAKKLLEEFDENKFSPKVNKGDYKKMTDFMDLTFDEKVNYDTYDNRRYIATQMLNIVGGDMQNIDKITLMNLIMDYSARHGVSNVKYVDWKEVDRDYAHLGLESTKHNLLIGAYDMPSKGALENELSRKGKPTKEEYVELAVKEFGTTYEPLEAGFVLPDGTMLDFSGKKQGGTGMTRAYDHRQIGAAYEDFDDLPGYTEGMQDFMVNTGALRISVNKDTLNVNYMGSLTDKQKDMIMTMSKGRDVVLDYDTKMGSGYETKAYEEIMTTEPNRYQKIRGFLDTYHE